jgi:hypothetical protein
MWVKILQEPPPVPSSARPEAGPVRPEAGPVRPEAGPARPQASPAPSHAGPAPVPSGQTSEEKRGTRTPSRRTTITLSESDVAAFLSHEAAQATDLSVRDLRVRLPEAKTVDLAARIRLGDLLMEPPAARLASALPKPWLERRVWIHVRGAARLEPGGAGGRRRYLRLDVGEFSIGRQRLPTALLRLLFDPAALRILRWPLPRDVEDVTIEPGRIIVRSAS